MNAEMVNLRLVTALCCFAVISVRHDAVAQYASELAKARQVSQHGVTWKFDREVPVGRFVNGDAYVVGPVTVVDIDPAPVDGINGSVLNLNPGRGKSGFDSRQNRGNSYDARMRSVPPISMMPGDSLLSSVSCEKQRQFPQMLWPFDPAKGMARCWVRSVSVLTCMAEPQPSDAFRPAFCDRENNVYLARDLRRDLLPKLKPVQGTPSPLEFAKHFQRCWVDVMRQNKAAPAEYAAQYGRETSRAGGMATLILMCDFTDAEKETLLVNFVQYGIDLYGTLEAGWSGWETLGGHGQGRKWPIVFAGIMFGSEAMARPDKTFPDIVFQEDDQTVYGKGWTGATALFAGHLGKSGWGLYPDRDRRGFFAEPVHPSQWPNDGKGTKFSNPGKTAEAYRRCCTSHAWIATALSIRIMHAEDVWNHDAFGDYCDRWMTEDDSEHVKILKEHAGLVIDGPKRQGQTWDPWVDALYQRYRGALPPAKTIAFVSDLLKQLSGVRLTTLCDVDETLLAHEYKKLDGRANKMKKYKDMRDVFDDSEIDAVFVALPNHWHALATIWACQAGKDVYVEKPASYNIWEGRQMVNAARKYKRIVQTGTQARSSDVESQLAEYIGGGQLGKVQLARAIIYRRRESIGKVSVPQPIPASVDYDQWLGPAPKTELMRKELHYLWHWDWATGNGEIGNNGVHYLDRCRWILGQSGLPRRAMSVGGRFQFDDDGQTPNTQIAFLDYDPAPIICEVRGLPEKPGGKTMDKFRGIDKGIIFQCEGGRVVSDRKATIAYDVREREIKRFKDRREPDTSASAHQRNFIAAIRSRKASDLNAEILDGHVSAALCHMANISHRLGAETQPGVIAEMTQGNALWSDAFQRFQQHTELNGIDLKKVPAVLGPWVTIDVGTEEFVGEFAGPANQLFRREYRAPFTVPESV